MSEEYNKKLRLMIVKENERGVSQRALAKKYGVAPATIKNWCLQYQAYGEPGIVKRLSKTKYSGEFTLSVLNYRHIRQVSYREAAEHFGIKQGSTIANRQRAYDTQGFDGLNGAPGHSKNKGDRAMTHQDKQPRNLSQSELEELIELREKNCIKKWRTRI
ncbi:helix-turn-helix domain-containing protein [Ruoffia tabacinasalis]|uniref:Transposase n=1 Tax=Ruoffia tabacinasalis TaxID=87458 RepID=A0ABS0LLV5_9LACT|nr:helix-turn-helix domain-containing protein [Ruoffia tabacinasalis]MBG9979238.1 transposase [Ruoffia tabacinasalis]